MDLPKRPIRTNPYAVYNGTAAEDLEQDSVVLKIICPELVPNSAFGTVGAGVTEGIVSLKDRDGGSISSSFTTANHVVATWEGSSNQRYAPLVRKGEPVEVFKIANQDKFYWRTTGSGRDFRSTDRLYVEISATDPKKPGSSKDDNSTYSAYLDSENKKAGLRTSNANGEVSSFSIEADLAAGTFHISDNGQDPSNRIFLDTGAITGIPVFQVNLSSGTAFKFEGDNVFLKVPGKLEIDAGDRFVINSPLTVFNLSQTGYILLNAANVAINSAKDIVVSAGNVMGISAASTKIGGVLVAASVRAADIVKGTMGSLYKPFTVRRPEETPVTSSSNSADTNMVGPPYKT